MHFDLINIGLALLEGFALIVSPCILPILPIILSGSLEGSKKRPLGIIFGFVIIFATCFFQVFTMALRLKQNQEHLFVEEGQLLSLIQAILNMLLN